MQFFLGSTFLDPSRLCRREPPAKNMYVKGVGRRAGSDRKCTVSGVGVVSSPFILRGTLGSTGCFSTPLSKG